MGILFPSFITTFISRAFFASCPRTARQLETIYIEIYSFFSPVGVLPALSFQRRFPPILDRYKSFISGFWHLRKKNLNGLGNGEMEHIIYSILFDSLSMIYQ